MMAINRNTVKDRNSVYKQDFEKVTYGVRMDTPCPEAVFIVIYIPVISKFVKVIHGTNFTFVFR